MPAFLMSCSWCKYCHTTTRYHVLTLLIYNVKKLIRTTTKNGFNITLNILLLVRFWHNILRVEKNIVFHLFTKEYSPKAIKDNSYKEGFGFITRGGKSFDLQVILWQKLLQWARVISLWLYSQKLMSVPPELFKMQMYLLLKIEICKIMQLISLSYDPNTVWKEIIYHSHIIISAIKFEQHVKNVENVQQFSKLEEKRIPIKIKKGTMILNSLLFFYNFHRE